MALLGNVGGRADPLLGYNFLVSLVDASSALALTQSLLPPAVAEHAVGGFNECTGLEVTLEVEDYQEGGRNGTVLRFPTRVTWSNLTLKKGIVGANTDLWDWLYGFAEGRVRRRDGIITLLDAQRQPATSWHFRRGLPVRYQAPSLNAQQSAVAIESIEIAHEGIQQLPG